MKYYTYKAINEILNVDFLRVRNMLKEFEDLDLSLDSFSYLQDDVPDDSKNLKINFIERKFAILENIVLNGFKYLQNPDNYILSLCILKCFFNILCNYLIRNYKVRLLRLKDERVLDSTFLMKSLKSYEFLKNRFLKLLNINENIDNVKFNSNHFEVDKNILKYKEFFKKVVFSIDSSLLNEYSRFFADEFSWIKYLFFYKNDFKNKYKFLSFLYQWNFNDKFNFRNDIESLIFSNVDDLNEEIQEDRFSFLFQYLEYLDRRKKSIQFNSFLSACYKKGNKLSYALKFLNKLSFEKKLNRFLIGVYLDCDRKKKNNKVDYLLSKILDKSNIDYFVIQYAYSRVLYSPLIFVHLLYESDDISFLLKEIKNQLSDDGYSVEIVSFNLSKLLDIKILESICPDFLDWKELNEKLLYGNNHEEVFRQNIEDEYKNDNQNFKKIRYYLHHPEIYFSDFFVYNFTIFYDYPNNVFTSFVYNFLNQSKKTYTYFLKFSSRLKEEMQFHKINDLFNNFYLSRFILNPIFISDIIVDKSEHYDDIEIIFSHPVIEKIDMHIFKEMKRTKNGNYYLSKNALLKITNKEQINLICSLYLLVDIYRGNKQLIKGLVTGNQIDKLCFIKYKNKEINLDIKVDNFSLFTTKFFKHQDFVNFLYFIFNCPIKVSFCSLFFKIGNDEDFSCIRDFSIIPIISNISKEEYHFFFNLLRRNLYSYVQTLEKNYDFIDNILLSHFIYLINKNFHLPIDDLFKIIVLRNKEENYSSFSQLKKVLGSSIVYNITNIIDSVLKSQKQNLAKLVINHTVSDIFKKDNYILIDKIEKVIGQYW